MRRASICALLALVVVLLQVMVVDRLPLPGGVVPDLALVVVVAVGLTQGPVTGAVTGFFAGLYLDLVPPGGHLIGESALIFCLTGYACGRLGAWLDGATPRLLAAGLIGVSAGETLQAAAWMLAGDPGVTLSAVLHVLPVAVLYDVLLWPMVLFLAALASRGRPVRTLAARSAWRLRPIGTSGLFRRRVRISRQVPRWPGGRPTILGARASQARASLSGSIGRSGRPP